MKWVNIDVQLPKKGERVLLWDSMFDWIVIETIDFAPEILDEDYTHWMLLPSPPKE